MIILLNGRSLVPKHKFQPEKLSINLSERQSTASMTIGPDVPVISVGDWVRIESGPGDGIVWRVKTIDEQFDKKTRTISLEHMILALKDRLMFGEIKPKDISGNNSNPTAQQTVGYILNYQTDWAPGDIQYTVSNPYNFNGDDLFSAIETVSSSLADCIWEYDFSVYPFRLHIRRMDSSVCSEMRTDRNIKTLKKTIDRSRMYTRHYPIGKNNLKISGNYVSKNESIYGVICKTETDQSKETESELKTWAQERLDRHCEPSVTITISGIDLSASTGESLDRFYIGKMCRVPLPEFSTTINERVTKLSYNDVIADPTNVSITLANDMEDVASIINSLTSSSSKSSRTSAKDDEEKHAWLIEANDHVGLLAEAVAGEGADRDWSRVSSIIVDGQGIHQQVKKVQGDLTAAETRIDMNEEAITLEAQRATTAEGELSGRITVTANDITMEVTNRQNADNEMSSRITATAEAIEAEVTNRENGDTVLQGKLDITDSKAGLTVTRTSKTDTREILRYPMRSAFPASGDTSYLYLDATEQKYYEWNATRHIYVETNPFKIDAGQICVSINESGETTATIEATKIHLLGETIANKITADYVKTKISQSNLINYNTLDGATVYASSSVQAANFYFTDDEGDPAGNLKNAIKELQITRSGNTYTLQKKSYNDDDWVNVDSFSRATSLSGAWSGSGKLTVTASPQNETFERLLSAGSRENSNGTAYTSGNVWYVPINALYGSSGQFSESTGYRVYVDATDNYNDGKNAIHLTSSWNNANDTLTIQKTTSGSTNAMSFAVSAAATIVYNSSTHTYSAIAQAKIDNTVRGDAASTASGTEAYVAGWQGYYDSNMWGKPQDNSGVCKIPNRDGTASEAWFTMSQISLTRVKTYVNGQGQAEYYGKLYYYDAQSGTYKYATDSDRYYYASGSNKAGSFYAYY